MTGQTKCFLVRGLAFGMTSALLKDADLIIRCRTWLAGDSPRPLKCPHCQQYSLTYDWLRNGYVCHIYNGFIPDEHMKGVEPCPIS